MAAWRDGRGCDGRRHDDAGAGARDKSEIGRVKKLYALAAKIAAPINAKRIRMEMDEGQDARGACVVAAGWCVWGGVEHGAPG